jgi:hypothetical protein
VIAHHVSMIVLRGRAARRVLGDTRTRRRARCFETVEQTGAAH